MNGDYNDLQKEWRGIVLNKLEVLELGQKEIQQNIFDIRGEFVKYTEYTKTFDSIDNRIDKLEQLKSKGVGVFFTLQIIFAIAVLLINKLL